MGAPFRRYPTDWGLDNASQPAAFRNRLTSSAFLRDTHAVRSGARVDGEIIEAAGDTATVADLAAQISVHVGRVVPHDGYGLFGLDPLTGTIAFAATKNTYSTAAGYRLEINHVAGRDTNPFAALIRGPRAVRVFGAGTPVGKDNAHLHDILAAEGVGSDLSIALHQRGTAWGGLALVRGADARPFTADEAAHAERLREPLAAALKRFVTRWPLHPARSAGAPGVLIVDGVNAVTAATPTGRDWLRTFAPDHMALDDGQLPGHVLSILAAARQPAASGARADGAISSIPTAHGWLALHAQPLDGGPPGQFAITIEPAAGSSLLSALTSWFGITPRERAVIDQVLDGLAVKQIARRLQLSPYTVTDHLAAVYRKTAVTGRDELVARLSR